ncbi:MAG: DNA mismatch repair endonuclease MutL [Clostridiales bacterium]|nr:DNA mismatch repair endonuclease MutL [Clostridiales bacterium]
MAKINLLDSSIFNLISAGEVVDKPMSVVKELVENSIDAGATSIEIEVRGGGIDYIRVVDNGCGIEKEEISKAFMPHATSKISSIEDLNTILTLGFRGEALASIAAVAKVTLVSRVENEELGYAVEYDSGNQVASYEVGAPKGTSITVENIFEKIPARQKFLRSAASEEADIANLITRLILANPTIAFKCTLGNKKIASTGEGVKSALIAVYGNEVLTNLEEVSLVMPDITIRGYIGKPSFSKHSRNYQTLIVNGRYVKSEDISYMVYLCYKDYLMSRQYPMFVLFIDLPADMVDVNVHPSKMEVKFVQAEKIKKLIRNAVNDMLNNITHQPKTIQSDYVSAPQPKVAGELLDDDYKESVKFDFSLLGVKSTLREAPSVLSYAKPKKEGRPIKTYEDIFGKNESVADKQEENVEEVAAAYGNNAAKNTLFDGVVSDNERNSFLGEEDVMTVGTLFSTYIIVEQGENCYLIDQHAAHERILYDKLVKKINDGDMVVQKLLFPYEFDLSFEEAELLDSYLDVFRSCGFELKKDGDRFSITAIPALLTEINLSKFLPLFFDAIKLDLIDKATFIKDTLAQTACKAAVKADRLLSLDEIKHLVRGVNTLGALQCPHGRPIVVKLSKLEVDKWFKRK